MKSSFASRRLTTIGCLITALSLLSGCSSTHIQSARHPVTNGPSTFRNVMVIGVDQRRDVRAPFENEAVRCLQGHGVGGTSSYDRFSLEQVNGDREQFRQLLSASGVASVLIVRVTDREDFVNGPPASLGSADASAVAESRYNALTTPGGEIKTALFLGGRLYRVSDGAVIWSCRLQEVMKEDADSDEFIRKTAKAIVDRLAGDKVIP